MKPAPFDLVRPETAEDALDRLHDLGDDARVLAGGQSLVPMLALRLVRFSTLVDISDIAELQGIDVRDGGWIRIGAGTRQSAVEQSPIVNSGVPLLARATPLIGHFQIRNRGTIGGALAHADPAGESPAVALTLDAVMEVRSKTSEWLVPADLFLKGTWTTCLEPDQLLLGVRFPVWGQRSGFAVKEVARRRGDFALVGAMCAVQLNDGNKIARSCITLFGVGATPIRCRAAEKELIGLPFSQVEGLGQLAAAEAEPRDDIHATGSYRRRVAATLVERGIREALDEALYG